jgi:3-phosphoglycerate kinase
MKILDKVQSKQDLIDHSSKIKKEINAFTDLMILAKEMEGEENQRMVSAEDEILSSELKEAMKRVYQIEGARELFENLQRDALHRLDYVLYQAKKEKSNS